MTRSIAFFATSFALLALATVAACDDTTVKESTVDARAPTPTTTVPPTPTPDGSVLDATPSDCVANPKTHAEIINACTTAVRVAKDPKLTKLLADGGLPPLP